MRQSIRTFSDLFTVRTGTWGRLVRLVESTAKVGQSWYLSREVFAALTRLPEPEKGPGKVVLKLRRLDEISERAAIVEFDGGFTKRRS